MRKLKERFRSFHFKYSLDSQLSNLRVQAGGYQRYSDSLADLVAQLPSKKPQDLLYAFLRGLSHDYRQQVFLLGDITKRPKR